MPEGVELTSQEAFYKALTTLTTKVDELVTETKKDLSTRKKSNWLIGVGIALLLFFSLLELGDLISASNAREEIADCSIPGKECYEERKAEEEAAAESARERQRNFVLLINCIDTRNAREILAQQGRSDGQPVVLPEYQVGCEAALRAEGLEP